MPARAYTFEILGPEAGRTIEISGYMFKAGKVTITGLNPDQAVFVARNFETRQAYEVGSSEHKAAWLMFEAKKKAKQQASIPKTPPAPPPVQSAEDLDAFLATGVDGVRKDAELGSPDGKGKSVPPGGSSSEADPGVGRGDAATGDTGNNASGPGHEHARLVQAEAAADAIPEWQTKDGLAKIQAAVLALDVQNDDHWTESGDPKMDAIESRLGRHDINRSDVNRAIGGYNRDDAMERATNPNTVTTNPFTNFVGS